MKPAAKFALQVMLLGVLVFAATIVGSAMGWLQYCPDPLMLPDGGMKQIFRAEDAGVEEIADGGVHDVTPWLESETLDAGAAASSGRGGTPVMTVDAGILIQDSETHVRE
ncbi:MAG: hypothetical protein ACJ790_15750 [Myxococcaceae bacterium]